MSRIDAVGDEQVSNGFQLSLRCRTAQHDAQRFRTVCRDIDDERSEPLALHLADIASRAIEPHQMPVREPLNPNQITRRGLEITEVDRSLGAWRGGRPAASQDQREHAEPDREQPGIGRRGGKSRLRCCHPLIPAHWKTNPASPRSLAPLTPIALAAPGGYALDRRSMKTRSTSEAGARPSVGNLGL